MKNIVYLFFLFYSFVICSMELDDDAPDCNFAYIIKEFSPSTAQLFFKIRQDGDIINGSSTRQLASVLGNFPPNAQIYLGAKLCEITEQADWYITFKVPKLKDIITCDFSNLAEQETVRLYVKSSDGTKSTKCHWITLNLQRK